MAKKTILSIHDALIAKLNNAKAGLADAERLGDPVRIDRWRGLITAIEHTLATAPNQDRPAKQRRMPAWLRKILKQ